MSALPPKADIRTWPGYVHHLSRPPSYPQVGSEGRECSRFGSTPHTSARPRSDRRGAAHIKPTRRSKATFFLASFMASRFQSCMAPPRSPESASGMYWLGRGGALKARNAATAFGSLARCGSITRPALFVIGLAAIAISLLEPRRTAILRKARKRDHTLAALFHHSKNGHLMFALGQKRT